MSDLRNQLQAAREKHRSQRYPGDLAAELLPALRHTVLKIFIAAAAISGIAAAILLFVGSHPVTPAPGPLSPLAVLTTQPVEDDDALAPMTALASPPAFPQDIPMAPSLEAGAGDTPMAPSFESIEIGSIPSMPSLDMNFTDTETQTSKEST